MKKYRFLPLLILFALFLFSCQVQTPETLPEVESSYQTFSSFENKETDPAETYEPQTLPLTAGSPVSTEQEKTPPPTSTTKREEIPPETVHRHDFKLFSQREASCSQTGERLFRCTCSAEQVEVLPQLPHTPDREVDCTTPSVCTRCGAVIVLPLGHQMQENHCLRCGFTVVSPVFVLGEELAFDESASSVEKKLGSPTERIAEGDIVSLVYAHDMTRLTVVQTDANGLWGVFTMDTEAFINLGGKNLSITSFSGMKDPDSDAYYQDVGSCRVFGFRDTLQSGEYYGLWMRYSECPYDYMEDSRLFTSFNGQNRLSYYYVNALRAKNGLSVLAWSDSAAAVATEYSAYMIENDFFNHDGSYADRLQQKGVLWTSAGENISQGYFNAFFVCDAYYNSSDHRANVLSSDFTHVGMGYCLREVPRSVFGAQIFFGL